jgi:hypothetical protein
MSDIIYRVSQYYSHQSIALPSFRSIKIPEFNLQAIIKPTGIRRIIKFLPYVTGNNVVFDLTLKTLQGDIREFRHDCKLYFVAPNRDAKQVSHDEILIKQDNNMVHTQISTWAAAPGHYSLELTYHYHDLRKIVPMVEFTVQSKDTLVSNWAIKFLYLIIGGLIAWLLTTILG